ncbi:hypothetical protein DSM104299_02349 [Baekduia alba]|uniref:MFS transporter n=1 Tax=Baekduia alba TaxID=2997333 RepID=UPI002341D9A2|nr:MFS transporter [Baekduia alba]WCB93633.1 hypothetical protein DSM104299_02349 [Baekduia alba]
MRRLLTVLCAIVFVDTTFYAVVAPLLPHYSDDLGLSKASAGILFAAYPAGTLVAAVPSGLLAARIGPRRTVIFGLALLGVSSVAFALAESVVVLDAARVVQGVAGACSWAGSLSWLVGEAPPERRGELIGTVFGAAIGGSLLGPVLGGAAGALGTAPVFGALAAVALALAVVAARTPGGARGDAGGATLRRTVASDRVRLGMWLVVMPGLGFGVIDVLVPLRLDDLGAGQVAISAAFLVAAVGEGLLSPVVGRVADRHGPLRPIRFGLVASAVVVVLIPVPTAVVPCALLMVLATAAFGTFWAPSMSLLSESAEAVGAHQGLAFGLVNLAWAVGMVGGAAGGGALAKATSDAVPYAVLAVICVGTLVGLARRRTAASMSAR